MRGTQGFEDFVYIITEIAVFFQEMLGSFGAKVTNLLPVDQVILRFKSRTPGYAVKICFVFPGVSSKSFSKIGRNAIGRSPDLACKPIIF